MTLQEKSLATIELPKILELLAAEAATPPAKELCRQLRPEVILSQCEKLQEETEDASRMIGLQGSPAFSGVKDISNALERAEKGGFLNPVELLAIGALLRAARLTKAYREERRDQQQSSLDGYFTLLTGNKFLEDKIENAIVSEEEISDHASSELYQIRRQIRTASAKVRDVLAKITSSNSKALQDNIVTQRNGRFVVPVKAEYRSTFPGMVHDTSSSGATLFVEPAAVVELNNNIRILTGKEKAEIERILAELSADTAQYAGSIRQDYELLCKLDFIFARGKLGYKMRGVRPKLLEKGRTEILKARHPLLNRDTAVPVTFTIGGAVDTVIITGPNTGGKTVGIKTLGLLTAMAQCGLQIPAGDNSQIVIFEHILADIGDEQSIEQSLSTFSSHMRTIVDILEVAGERTLVLLDELGAGTDPVEGAALARAIIQELRDRGCTVAATTHYAELKVFALETPGVENASCEFDVQTLRPTYRLIFGVPGKSNAFAISQRLGLDTEEVGVHELETTRSECTVVVYEDLMLSSLSYCALVEVYHPLVATVHEVNLHTLNAPLSKLLEHTGVLLNTTPCEPKDHVNTHLLTVSDNLVEVTCRVGSIGIHVVLSPAFVHYDILDTILRSEVHEVLVSLYVQTCNEIHIGAVRNSSVPPLPACLTRNNP